MNILFLDKNITDSDEIYIANIYRLPLTTELSFIGHKGFGNFLPIFQIVLFFGFHSKKCPLKLDASQNKNYKFWRKQIISMNQACHRIKKSGLTLETMALFPLIGFGHIRRKPISLETMPSQASNFRQLLKREILNLRRAQK